MEILCDRCHEVTHIWIQSIFNTDILCMDCKEKESKHPKYPEARAAEQRACEKGNFNFPGIGKPEDL